MEDLINFKIRNFGPINNCDINIGKINIIGGNNSTGKSTASKILYCFLKANSNNRQEFAYEAVISLIRSVIVHIGNDFRYNRRIRNMDFIEIIDEYEKLKQEYYDSNEYGDNKNLDEDIQELDIFLKEIQENGDSLYLSIMRNLLQNEFLTKEFNGCFSIKDYRDKNHFKSEVNFLKYDFDSDDAFKSKGSIDIHDVFYIDSFSIFDIHRSLGSFRFRKNSFRDHVDYLRLMLRDDSDESKELFDDQKNKNIISVEKKIKQIIGGKIEFNRGRFMYISKDSGPCEMQNTASGIKQIGVIQLLLSNRKLKKDSFLIIDEPEVNLHPDWQFKLAQILILLVKDLNISIYVNTHSPMFIEAIEVLTQYYDMEKYTNFYLTEKDNESGYNFTKIDYDNLYELYKNLSRPFDAIEVFRLKTEYRKKDIDGGI